MKNRREHPDPVTGSVGAKSSRRQGRKPKERSSRMKEPVQRPWGA